MKEDLDLTAFENAWTADRPSFTPTAELRAIREIRKWYAGIAIEWLIGLVFIAWSTLGAVQDRTVEHIELAVAIWIFSTSALAFSTWNRRGLARLAAQPTRQFIRFQTQRRVAQRRAIAFGFGLWTVEMVFVVGWRIQHPVAEPAWLLALRLTIAFAILLWLVWLDFRTRQELRQLEILQTQLELIA